MRCISIPILLLALFACTGLRANVYETPPKAEDPVVEAGSFIDLASGDRLQLFIDDKQVVACFVNADGFLIPSPAESLLFIIDDPQHRLDEWRTVLNKSGDIILTSPRRLFGPYDFRARIIIRYPGEKTESFANVAIDLEKAAPTSP